MFKHHFKKLMAFITIMILVIGCTGIHTTQVSAAGTATVGNGKYTIISNSKMTVQYAGTAKASATSVSIPATIKIGSKTYKVAGIAANALKNNTKIKKLTIGKNVSKIGKNAFYGCKNLKTISIKTTGLAKSSVGANAFKGLNANVVITVPSEKLNTYKALLKSRGITGTKQTIKGKNAEKEKEEKPDNSPSGVSSTSKTYFEKDMCFFNIRLDGSTSSSGYSAGDTIPLRTRFSLSPEPYGHWEEDSRKLTKGYVQCAKCGMCFTDYMLALHDEMELKPGGCWVNYYIGLDGKQPTTWAFIPDKNPCKVVLRYTFPQGISYKEGSLKVIKNKISKENVTDSCIINSSGNELVITINDIKSVPFYKAFKYEEYQKNLYYDPSDDEDDFRAAFLVELDAVVDSNISSSSVISSTMSYTHKDASHADTYNIAFRSACMTVLNKDASGNSLSDAEFDLYQKKTRYPAGSNFGTSDWELFKSGIHAGDVITGLGTGTDAFDNQYKLVQTKAPDGYEEAYDAEFELFISENGTVTAESEDGDALEVKNGVVQVCVVNDEGSSASKNTAPKDNSTVSTEPQKTVESPVISTPVSSGKKGINVKAIYYQDGVRESSLTFHEVVDASETMMDKKDISDRAYFFKGYKLQKITLNGEEVDSLPDKVKDGSEICFYYVTE